MTLFVTVTYVVDEKYNPTRRIDRKIFRNGRDAYYEQLNMLMHYSGNENISVHCFQVDTDDAGEVDMLISAGKAKVYDHAEQAAYMYTDADKSVTDALRKPVKVVE